jgi:hypothetical protein
MAAKAAHHGDASAGGADAAAIPCYRPIMGPASVAAETKLQIGLLQTQMAKLHDRVRLLRGMPR